MAKGMMEIKMIGAKQIQGKLNKINKEAEKVTKRTLSDIRKRAPGWVATSVTNVYNIKKADVRGSETKGKKPAGSVKVTGKKIDEMQLVFEGRLLTPVHFGMTPKVPPKGKNYTLRMQVKKGQRQVIGRYKAKRTAGGPYSEQSHNILLPTGANSPDKVSHIPFQRMSKRRNDIKKFTTLSIPQMITSEDVTKDIQETLNENVGKRLDHHLQSAQKRL